MLALRTLVVAWFDGSSKARTALGHGATALACAALIACGGGGGSAGSSGGSSGTASAGDTAMSAGGNAGSDSATAGNANQGGNSTAGDSASAGSTSTTGGTDGAAGSDGIAGDTSAAGTGGTTGSAGSGAAGGGGTAGFAGNSGSAGSGGDSSLPPHYAVGGTITGLPGGQSVVLQNNGGDNLTLNANGAFQFPTQLTVGASYAVSVLTQPAGATCTVSNGASNTSTDSVSAVTVACSAVTRTLSGNLTGVASGATIVLENNGGDDLTLTQNGGFTFSTAVANGSSYAITVKTAPLGETCTVSNGSGTANANVTAIGVDCELETFTIGGSLTGLGAGKTVVLRDNGGNDLTLSTNGSFTFSQPIASGTSYAVTVFVQASGQTCSVSSGTGLALDAKVTNVSVTCSSNSYTIGGALSGLPASKSVVLEDNGGNDLLLSGNGPFTFTASIADSASYAVTVSTQPVGVTCSVSNATGKVNGANVTTIGVSCSTNAYTIGGAVTGLDPGKALVLRNNGGDDLTITANGGYTFATPVTSGSPYAVTLQSQPKGQTCNVVSAGGNVGTSNVSNVNVFCSDLGYAVGGTISGLNPGNQVILNLNGSTGFSFTNGPFTLPPTLVDGQSYAAAVTFTSFGQRCIIANASGTIDAASVTNLAVTCANAYFLNVNVQTLASGQTVVIQNNGGDDLTIKGPSTNGSSGFATAVFDQTTYNVTVSKQPTGQTCAVKNATGTINGANTSGPIVVCSQLAINVQASTLANAKKVNTYVFSGSTLVAGWQNLVLDANGNGSQLLSTATTDMASLTTMSTFFPAALLDGTYSVLVQVDKSSNGLVAANADDWNYFGTVTVGGPTTLTLTNASFKPFVSFGLVFTGQTAVANMNYFCSAHLPGGDIFADFAQRSLFGAANGTTSGTGTGTAAASVMAQGTFDFTCLADNPNASSGTTELQPYSFTSGKGVDSGFDYVATKTGVSVTAAGAAAVSGFAAATFSTGSVACSGTYTSGGMGSTGTFNGNNNSSVLSGAGGCVVGTATGVHKTVAVGTVTGTGAGHYTFGPAYLENRVSTSFAMIIPITNSSGSAKGGLGLAFNGATFFDSMSNNIGTSSSAKVAASTCVSGSSLISTCLAPNETGYVLITGSGYANIASVNLSIGDNAAVTGINARAIPQTFTRYSDGEVRIRVTNNGTGNADFSTLSSSNDSFIVAFDASGNPSDFSTLATGYVDHVITSNHIAGTSAPKNSIVFVHQANGAPIDAASPSLKVFLSFGDTAIAPN